MSPDLLCVAAVAAEKETTDSARTRHLSKIVRPIHKLVWLALITAFLCISGPEIWSGIKPHSIRLVGPNHSTDLYLEMAGGIDDGARRLGGALAVLPPKKPILVLTDVKDPRSVFLGFMTAYLAWPREVSIAKLQGISCEKELRQVNPSSLAAVVFCGDVKIPTWMPRHVSLGEWLAIVPIRNPSP